MSARSQYRHRSREIALQLIYQLDVRPSANIDEAIELLEEKQADAIVSVCEMDHSPLWSNILPEDGNMRGFLREEILNKRSQDLENEENVLEAVRDMADGLNAPAVYEKASFLLDLDRSHETILDVANAYYIAGDLVETKRLLSEVRNPIGKDEEEFLDLSVACAHKEGDLPRAIKFAEVLYEKFPKEFNLARLTQIVPAKQAEFLLDEHEKYRLGDVLNENYIDLLISLEKVDRLKAYINRFEEDLAGVNPEVLSRFVERLETMNQKELAEKI